MATITAVAAVLRLKVGGNVSSPANAALIALAAIFLARSFVPPRAAAQHASVTADQVNEAIERGANFLVRAQKADGSWPERPLYGKGLTPLCTLALLSAGHDAESEPARKALAHLRNLQPDATYAASLQTMAFCRGEPLRDLPLIVRNVRWLEAHQIVDGENAGMWAIPREGTPDHTDNSMTHMAMLALDDAELAGAIVSDRTWRLGRDAWRRTQNVDGSWGWGPGFPGTGSMTAAGIASLRAADARLDAATVNGERLECCGAAAVDAEAARGLSWLSRSFAVGRNPGADYWHSYYLFALERVGRLTAQRFIGQHDWYREGASVLVGLQERSGAWPSDMDEEHLADSLVSTSFSLMFLAKARRPLVLAQLQHGAGDDWNRHPHALTNLALHAGRQWKADLAYQTVDVEKATVEELLETPVLYLSGHKALNLSPEAKRKLRMAIDRGAFLFAAPSCEGGEFDASFRRLAAELFPEPESRLRPLEPSHPAWRVDERVDPTLAGELWGCDVACRTAIIYAPRDLACRWELGRRGAAARLPAVARREAAAALGVGNNILAYATNREVKFKDPLAPRDVDLTAEAWKRGTIYIANVLHDGGCAAASGALWTLARLAEREAGLPVDATPREVRLSDSNLFRFNLLVIHGRSRFEWTDAERKNLRLYLLRGGGVLADAICSNEEFASSLRRELAIVFPEGELVDIPSDDPLWTPQYGGYDVQSVQRRTSGAPGAEEEPGGSEVGPPRLKGLRIGDRWGVLFSPLDLSCALESRDAGECPGYVRTDAAKIAVNAMAYLLH